ncbi:MAG TPA: VOC family protein [Geminicoccaceae bacterium]|nr:VOC family protein [Geminicoccus sp.]HMU48228.1 VOC family protein [Geminicoccaceae bacterium]
MPDSIRSSLPNIFPCLIYDDSHAAIAWLEKAFGFEKHVVYSGPDGSVAHAELKLGAGMVMLGSGKEGAGIVKSPQMIYVAVEDSDGLFRRAKAAGADVVREPNDTDYGSRDFAVRDPEGNLWNFGTYLPGA